jgi:ubiquinone/menaquinone biosynthesis C-methylase UbiE
LFSWTAPAASARFLAGIGGGDNFEGAQPNSAWPPVVLEALDALRRTQLENAIVLDYGCGSGSYKKIFNDSPVTSNWTYVGADINAAVVEMCRKNDEVTRYEVVLDNSPTPFVNESFDVVFASGVFQCVANPDKLLKEFSRITRQWVVISRIPVRKYAPPSICIQSVWHKWGKEVHPIHIFRRNELHLMFIQNGFEITWCDTGVESFYVPGDPEAVIHSTYLLRKVSGVSNGG